LKEERIPPRFRRRTTLIGAVLVGLLAVGAVVLLTQEDDAPVRGLRRDVDVPTDSDDGVASTPAFRFTKATRKVVPTSGGRIKRRQREAGEHATVAARTVLDGLYTEGFLDPTNWTQGEYASAFRGFAKGARMRALAHPGLLTAGARAGDRYEEILPVAGRIDTRVLVARGGRPTLVLSVVRFSAVATGPEPVTFRSRGQFFFERVRGSWKIVSFHVTRADAPREPA
jgi:hypothetical protein